MHILVRALGQTLAATPAEAIDISIAQRFDAAQPNAFGLPDADCSVVRGEGYALSVAEGGAVNCSTLTITPHANGTHTESVAHITHDGPNVLDALRRSLHLARLITVPLIPREDAPNERYIGRSEPHDRVISAETLRTRLPRIEAGVPEEDRPSAVVIRTLPNPPIKATRRWATTNPPYFTEDAMVLLRERGYQHLLVDLPSVDREQDDGAAAAHRAWWGLPPIGTAAGEQPSLRTITEMIRVADEIPDGLFLLELQIAPFALDAAPSRPRLIPLRRLPSPH